MKQRAYSTADYEAYRPVSIAGIQTKKVDIIHGTFRTVFKVEGDNGGACAGFFWYHDDNSEIDIELVTAGTSIVNNTINYTLHPSLAPDGSRIPNATISLPMDEVGLRREQYHEYRFDCHPKQGVDYYVDGRLIHSNNHNIPGNGGSVQMKLWADGNSYWSGIPSRTEVTMSIKSIVAYYNTSTTDSKWHAACKAAGENSVCHVK